MGTALDDYGVSYHSGCAFPGPSYFLCRCWHAQSLVRTAYSVPVRAFIWVLTSLLCPYFCLVSHYSLLWLSRRRTYCNRRCWRPSWHDNLTPCSDGFCQQVPRRAVREESAHSICAP